MAAVQAVVAHPPGEGAGPGQVRLRPYDIGDAGVLTSVRILTAQVSAWPLRLHSAQMARP